MGKSTLMNALRDPAEHADDEAQEIAPDGGKAAGTTKELASFWARPELVPGFRIKACSPNQHATPCVPAFACHTARRIRVLWTAIAGV